MNVPFKARNSPIQFEVRGVPILATVNAKKNAAIRDWNESHANDQISLIPANGENPLTHQLRIGNAIKDWEKCITEHSCYYYTHVSNT